MLILNADTTRSLLDHAGCVDVMAQAMSAFSAGKVDAPVRQVIRLGEQGHFFVMPGAITSGPVYGAKLVNLVPDNPQRGLPNVQGFIALFDHETGVPLALVDGTAVTYVRTAAASALATRELARRNAKTLGLFGAGTLAGEHLLAIATVRELEEIRICDRTAEKAAAFANHWSARTGLRIIAAQPADTAACDIVTAVTSAPEPVIAGHWLQPGAHLNLVGAHSPEHREADSDAARRARIFVDSMDSALSEAGDILIPLAQGEIDEGSIIGEIGAVLNGDVAGRQNDSQITLYKSLGLAAQDLFAADHAYRQALESGQGIQVDFS